MSDHGFNKNNQVEIVSSLNFLNDLLPAAEVSLILSQKSPGFQVNFTGIPQEDIPLKFSFGVGYGWPVRKNLPVNRLSVLTLSLFTALATCKNGRADDDQTADKGPRLGYFTEHEKGKNDSVNRFKPCNDCCGLCPDENQ